MINVTSFFRDAATWHYLSTAIIPALLAEKEPSEPLRIWSAGTLMYFNAETQKRILARFRFALSDIGILFLGKAEMMFSRPNFFTLLNLKHRIFSKVPKPTFRDRLLLATQTLHKHLAGHIRLREAAFDSAQVAQVVLDRQGVLTLANQQARAAFHILSQDVGRRFHEPELSYHPAELRSHIEQIYAEPRAHHVPNVERLLAEGEVQYLDVHLTPLFDHDQTPLGVSITFHDVTHHQRLQAELEKNRHDLETAYEELQSTNEELETTNEELQSTVEELETTNEELQSTNEELETMNEELQSSNEELRTINDELRDRTAEVTRAKAFLESILASLHTAAVVVDTNFNVLMWNTEVQELWGLRSDEVQGHSLMSLDIGLPVEPLRGPMRTVLQGRSKSQEVILDATNRRGRALRCRIECTPLCGIDGAIQGVILFMEERRDPA